MQYNFDLKHLLDNYQHVSIYILKGYFHQTEKTTLIEAHNDLDHLETAIQQLKNEVIAFRMENKHVSFANITISGYTLESRCRYLIDVGNQPSDVLQVLTYIIKQLSDYRNKIIMNKNPIESVKQSKNFGNPHLPYVSHDSRRPKPTTYWYSRYVKR